MPLFFFDTDDGDLRSDDDVGIELADVEAARRMAQSSLPDMAREELPNGERRDFTVQVRDEAGTKIYSARLALTGEWHVPRAS